MKQDIVESMQKVLTAGLKILIVGVLPKDKGKWHNVHDPRLIFWDSRATHNELPAKVGLVIRTRYCGHSKIKRIKVVLARSSLSSHLYHRPISPGELKTILEQTFS